MSPPAAATPADLPVYGEDTDILYTIDIIAEMAGVDPRTILHYQEQGFIRPVSPADQGSPAFDTECLRQLRRIEHLRHCCEVNDAGLKLILGLLQEVEYLRQERRQACR